MKKQKGFSASVRSRSYPGPSNTKGKDVHHHPEPRHSSAADWPQICNKTCQQTEKEISRWPCHLRPFKEHECQSSKCGSSGLPPSSKRKNFQVLNQNHQKSRHHPFPSLQIYYGAFVMSKPCKAEVKRQELENPTGLGPNPSSSSDL